MEFKGIMFDVFQTLKKLLNRNKMESLSTQNVPTQNNPQTLLQIGLFP